MNGARKAAVLLVSVGEELAKEILRVLPEADVQRLTEELADLRGITPELSAEILEEFWELLATQNFMVHGGLDYASRLLMETFGKERAEDLLLSCAARRRRRRATWLSCSELILNSWASCWMPSIHRRSHWCWLTWIRDALRRSLTT